MGILALHQPILQLVKQVSEEGDALMHVHAGLALLIFARLLTGKSLGSAMPLVLVFTLECLHELFRGLFYADLKPSELLSNIVNTMFWPLIFCAAVKLRPIILHDRTGKCQCPADRELKSSAIR